MRTIAATELALAALAVANPATAAPGDPDATFGSGGTISGTGDCQAFVTGGRIVELSGDAELTVRVRLASGAPDASFSGDGVVQVANADWHRGQVDVDASGRITVAVATRDPEYGLEVWRFKPNGDPDATFGTGGNVFIEWPGDIFPGVGGRRGPTRR